MSAALTTAAHAAGAVLADAMPRSAWDPNPIPAARLTAPASERAGILSRGAIRQIRAEREAAAAADAECACLFSAAEQLAVLADREDGEAGDDPEAIGALAVEAAALLERARVVLGAKPERIKDATGRTIGRVWRAA